MKLEDFTIGQLHKAVALHYDGRNNPVIIATGKNTLAKEIVETAKANDVPICTNESLASLLENLEVGEEIPIELYQAIACVLSFAYKIVLEQNQDA